MHTPTQLCELSDGTQTQLQARCLGPGAGALRANLARTGHFEQPGSGVWLLSLP